MAPAIGRFKDFYTRCVLPHGRSTFPSLVSYPRLVELMPWCLMRLCGCRHPRKGEVTGIALIDSTPLAVCLPARAPGHRVFAGWVNGGKNSVGWYFGFKLPLIVNERGELLAFKLTPANVDDRQPVPDLTQDLMGKLCGDRGYICQALFETLYARGLQLMTKSRENMKNRLLKLIDKLRLRQRAVIESVNEQLKDIGQIEHSRHRRVYNFLVNLLAGLVAYTYQPRKPSLDLDDQGLPALPAAIF